MDLYPELPHYTGRKNQNRDWEGYVIIVYINYDMEPASRTILVSVQTPTVDLQPPKPSADLRRGRKRSLRCPGWVGLGSLELKVWVPVKDHFGGG